MARSPSPSHRRPRPAGSATSGLYRACWYRRSFDAPGLGKAERLVLLFGAVDYAATVWVNGLFATAHEGGFTPFQVDITDLLDASGPQSIVVRALDDPRELAKPRGKQDWQPEPHSIWYPRTTGIWQTVWLERVPASRIGTIRWVPCLQHWEIGFEMRVDGERRDDLRLDVRLEVGDRRWRTTPTRSWPGRSTAGSPCPTRGSTTRATNCSGAPSRRP